VQSTEKATLAAVDEGLIPLLTTTKNQPSKDTIKDTKNILTMTQWLSVISIFVFIDIYCFGLTLT